MLSCRLAGAIDLFLTMVGGRIKNKYIFRPASSYQKDVWQPNTRRRGRRHGLQSVLNFFIVITFSKRMCRLSRTLNEHPPFSIVNRSFLLHLYNVPIRCKSALWTPHILFFFFKYISLASFKLFNQRDKKKCCTGPVENEPAPYPFTAGYVHITQPVRVTHCTHHPHLHSKEEIIMWKNRGDKKQKNTKGVVNPIYTRERMRVAVREVPYPNEKKSIAVSSTYSLQRAWIQIPSAKTLDQTRPCLVAPPLSSLLFIHLLRESCWWSITATKNK